MLTAVDLLQLDQTTEFRHPSSSVSSQQQRIRGGSCILPLSIEHRHYGSGTMGEACPPGRSILCGGGSTYVHASTRLRLVIDFDDLSKPCSSPKSVLRSMITSRTSSGCDPFADPKTSCGTGYARDLCPPPDPLLRASPRSRPQSFHSSLASL